MCCSVRCASGKPLNILSYKTQNNFKTAEIHNQRIQIDSTRSEVEMNPSSAMITVDQQAVQGEKFL